MTIACRRNVTVDHDLAIAPQIGLCCNVTVDHDLAIAPQIGLCCIRLRYLQARGS